MIAATRRAAKASRPARAASPHIVARIRDLERDTGQAPRHGRSRVRSTVRKASSNAAIDIADRLGRHAPAPSTAVAAPAEAPASPSSLRRPRPPRESPALASSRSHDHKGDRPMTAAPLRQAFRQPSSGGLICGGRAILFADIPGLTAGGRTFIPRPSSRPGDPGDRLWPTPWSIAAVSPHAALAGEVVERRPRGWTIAAEGDLRRPRTGRSPGPAPADDPL